MTYPENMLKELDVIELRVAVDAWEAGTVATVLEVATDSVLVEIANEDGRTLDVLTVPNGAAAPLDARDVPAGSAPDPGSPRSVAPARPGSR